MNSIDHFTIPLPQLGYIVSFVRVANHVGWHGSLMTRQDGHFKSEGGDRGDWVTMTDENDVQEVCEILADQAASSLVQVKYGEPRADEEDALRGTLRNAIKTRTWKH